MRLTPVNVAAGLIHGGNEAVGDRIGASLENDGNRRGCCFGRQAGGGGTKCGYHSDATANEISRQRWQSIVPTLRPSIFDSHIAALDVAIFG
jgi:hypothetical protein